MRDLNLRPISDANNLYHPGSFRYVLPNGQNLDYNPDIELEVG